ncbi:VOC family protein [uncultured Winogradskyella sp.]|uniref:VOC family protein n=1 Tax=uncultured Winogradskyella sp. TaxID=395353 RepID=UPI0026071BD7|nr:VOC family protein [uncultured Winogradskyella sp.]
MNLNQVTITSLDVSKSAEFYKTLGLTLIVDALPKYVRLECPNGESTFSISNVDELSQGNKIRLYFEVDKLSETVTKLKEKGITFNTKITEQSWLWTDIHLTDPDGHELIIYNAGENRKNPPWRINK